MGCTQTRPVRSERREDAVQQACQEMTVKGSQETSQGSGETSRVWNLLPSRAGDPAGQPSATPRGAGPSRASRPPETPPAQHCSRSPSARHPGRPLASPRYLVPLLLQLDHLALQDVHLLPVHFAVHLGFLELEQGLLLLFPVLNRGGQTWPMKVSGCEGGAEDGWWGSLEEREGGSSRGEIR